MVYKEYLEQLNDSTGPSLVFSSLVEEDDEFVESMFYYEIRNMVESSRTVDIDIVFRNCGLFYNGFKGNERIENLYAKALNMFRGYQ